MAPTEMVFWEAKHRPSSLKDSRRPSTTIDANGCVIQRGFVIPSRTSSFDSRSATSSPALEDSGTPASPMPDPIPGYSRPTGSLMNAPELQVLRRSDSSPQCSSNDYDREKPQVGGARPFVDRRQTWQAGGGSSPIVSGRLEDDDLAAVTCTDRSIFDLKDLRDDDYCSSVYDVEDQKIKYARRNREARKTNFEAGFRRVKSEMVNLKYLKGKVKNKGPATAVGAKKKHKKDIQIVAKAEAENAIASDSEGEDARDAPTVGDICAQRKRPSYAMRRARSDQLAAERNEQENPVDDDSALTAQVRYLKICSPSQAESAIESEDEEDGIDSGKDPISRALSLAQDHKSINTRIVELPCQATERFREHSVCFEVNTSTSADFKESDDASLETPREIKSFDHLSRMPKRYLRPSRSQPVPVKGVLKKSGSAPSSSPPKHVVTAVRCSSTPAIKSPIAEVSSVRFKSIGCTKV